MANKEPDKKAEKGLSSINIAGKYIDIKPSKYIPSLSLITITDYMPKLLIGELIDVHGLYNLVEMINDQLRMREQFKGIKLRVSGPLAPLTKDDAIEKDEIANITF